MTQLFQELTLYVPVLVSGSILELQYTDPRLLFFYFNVSFHYDVNFVTHFTLKILDSNNTDFTFSQRNLDSCNKNENTRNNPTVMF